MEKSGKLFEDSMGIMGQLIPVFGEIIVFFQRNLA